MRALVRVVAADAIVKLGDISATSSSTATSPRRRRAAVRRRRRRRAGVTLADVGRRRLGGYTPAQFRADLDADASDALAARAAAAATEPPTPDEVAALAEAYVRLAPLEATKDEL